MKMKGKRKWLLLLAGIILVIFLAKSAYTPANILGIPFFSNAFAVIGPGQRGYAGDTFTYTFSLKNRDTQALPMDLFDSDGDGVIDKRILLYKGYKMLRYNTMGTQEEVTSGCNTPNGVCVYVEEVTTQLSPSATTPISLTFSIIPTTPSSYAGHPYGVSAMLFKVTQTWARATNVWSNTTDIIDSITTNTSLAVKFDVTTQTPPPSPTTAGIIDWFNDLFAAIWNALKALFGW